MVELYLHSPTRLHGVVLNELSTGTTLSYLNHAVSISFNWPIVSNDWIVLNTELKRWWKKRPWPNLGYYPCTCPEGLRNTTRTSVRIVVYRPRFEPGICRMQIGSVIAWVSLLGPPSLCSDILPATRMGESRNLSWYSGGLDARGSIPSRDKRSFPPT
jgi:hypothetical protein